MTEKSARGGAKTQNFLFYSEKSPFFGPQNPKNLLFLLWKISLFLALKTLKTYSFLKNLLLFKCEGGLGPLFSVPFLFSGFPFQLTTLFLSPGLQEAGRFLHVVADRQDEVH